MTTEKLKQEAEVWMHNALFWLKLPISKENVEQGGSYILKLLEPREKRIAELEEKLANADYQLEGRDLEIKELEAQIEKMINEIDKTMVFSNMRECEIYDIQDIFRKYNFRWNNDKWEIKEK